VKSGPFLCHMLKFLYTPSLALSPWPTFSVSVLGMGVGSGTGGEGVLALCHWGGGTLRKATPGCCQDAGHALDRAPGAMIVIMVIILILSMNIIIIIVVITRMHGRNRSAPTWRSG
jgi:hypothetical protein